MSHTSILRGSRLAGPRLSLRGLLETLASADARYRQGLRLRELDDHMLRDMGVSRADVAHALRRADTW